MKILRSGFSRNQSGFTLIELMVVVAIMGIALTAMYGLYTRMQGGTSDQQEVLDVQQNLRYAMDILERDVQRSGFLCQDTIAAASDNATLMMNMGTTMNRFARAYKIGSERTSRVMVQIDGNPETEFIPADTLASAEIKIPVATREMADLFAGDDVTVRIVRPSTSVDVLNANPLNRLRVIGTNRLDPSITVTNIDITGETKIVPGDLIFQVFGNTPAVSSVTWSLNGTDLERSALGSATELIATGIRSVTFRYLNSSGVYSDTPDGDTTAVRVVLEADAAGQSDRVVRGREMRGVFTLKN